MATTGCPFLENNVQVSCFSGCKNERLGGHWKICIDSSYDPLARLTRQSQANLFEVISTGLSDEGGQELFEVYQQREYCGSCYATSAQEALVKAQTSQLLAD